MSDGQFRGGLRRQSRRLERHYHRHHRQLRPPQGWDSSASDGDEKNEDASHKRGGDHSVSQSRGDQPHVDTRHPHPSRDKRLPLNSSERHAGRATTTPFPPSKASPETRRSQKNGPNQYKKGGRQPSTIEGEGAVLAWDGGGVCCLPPKQGMNRERK